MLLTPFWLLALMIVSAMAIAQAKGQRWKLINLGQFVDSLLLVSSSVVPWVSGAMTGTSY
jgi:hypothetical protein